MKKNADQQKNADQKKWQIKASAWTQLHLWLRWVLFIVGLLGLLVAFVAFSLLDLRIPWPDKIDGNLGISLQIVTAISTCIVSVIGIAIPLQKDNFMGISISKFYSLRRKPIFKCQSEIILSIFLCTVGTVVYLLGLKMAIAGTCLISVFLCIYFAKVEIPFMCRDKASYIRVIKDCIKQNYFLSTKEFIKDQPDADPSLKQTIQYLLTHETLGVVFNYFKGSDKQYNSYVMGKLMEYQMDATREFARFPDPMNPEQVKKCGTIVRSIQDVLDGTINLQDIPKTEPPSYLDLLANTLLYLDKAQYKGTYESVNSALPALFFSKNDALKEIDFEVIMRIITYTVSNGNLKFLKALCRGYSGTPYYLENESDAALLFDLISMYLYYLCCCEPQFPEERKNLILQFLDETYLEGIVKIYSWKSLFQDFSDNYPTYLHRFIKAYKQNEMYMEFCIVSGEAYFVVLDISFAIKWYFTNFLNTERGDYLGFEKSIESDSEIIEQLIGLGDKCFDENKVFHPTEAMNKQVAFLGKKEYGFDCLSIVSKQDSGLFDYINSLKQKKLDDKADLCAGKDFKVLEKKIEKSLVGAVTKEWGCDNSLKVTDEEKIICSLIRYAPDAYNIDDFLAQSFTKAVLRDISGKVPCTKEKSFKEFTSEQIDDFAKIPFAYKMPGMSVLLHYITDSSAKENLKAMIDNAEEINSKIIPVNSLIKDGGFSFNFHLSKVEVRNLTEDELANEVKKFQREDGQYVYEGTFLPYEKVSEIVKKIYIVITIIFSHQVQSNEGDIVRLYLN